MIIDIKRANESYQVDLSAPLDISLPITTDPEATRAWYIDQPSMKPVILGDWIGDVNKGSGVNFYNIQFNPHAHGTHTETAGHVMGERYSINQNLKDFFFWAELISIQPKTVGDDLIIDIDALEGLADKTEAVIIRTYPNIDKRHINYSNTNPPYLSVQAIAWLRDRGVKHLLIDLPSVDPEQDGGAVAAHHAFWNTKEEIRFDATITELIYVSDEIKDGLYFMNLQVAAFENDAAPSRPLLFIPRKA